MGNGLERLYSQFMNDFKKKCDSFESELRNETPIDTGDMIRSWRTIQPHQSLRVISNLMPYSAIIARGRVFVGGRWYGSLKGWGKGGVKPLIRKHFERKG